MKFFQPILLIFLISMVLVDSGCQSNHAQKLSADSMHVNDILKPPADPLPPNFKFSFYIEATGMGSKPADSWTMDTTGTMTVHTSKPNVRDTSGDIRAFAVLDQRDMDSLRLLIRKGKLYTIDSADLNEQCGRGEFYVIRIVPLAKVPYMSATFDACAADYNLLLEPQRKYLRAFIDWWERMRVKYRPGDVN